MKPVYVCVCVCVFVRMCVYVYCFMEYTIDKHSYSLPSVNPDIIQRFKRTKLFYVKLFMLSRSYYCSSVL